MWVMQQNKVAIGNAAGNGTMSGARSINVPLVWGANSMRPANSVLSVAMLDKMQWISLAMRLFAVRTKDLANVFL